MVNKVVDSLSETGLFSEETRRSAEILDLKWKAVDGAFQDLCRHQIRNLIRPWIISLKNVDTQENYCRYFEEFRKRKGIITHDGNDNYLTIKEFCERNHVEILVQIASVERWSKATRAARVACYRAFCKYIIEKTPIYFPELFIEDEMFSESLLCKVCTLQRLCGKYAQEKVD